MIADILIAIAKGDLLTDEQAAELRAWAGGVENAPELFSQIFKGLSTIPKLSQIATDLGSVNRGVFISGDDGDPLDTTGNDPFTGVTMMSPGLSVDSGNDEAALWGMNAGVLTFWISNLTGKILAGGGSVQMDDNGIRVYDGSGVLKVDIQSDGDVFVGSDLSAAATTSLSIFVSSQTYNGESMGAGDILIGSNSGPNVLYDASATQLKFRDGTTVNVYMDTDGTLRAGAGKVILDANGVTISQPSGALTESSIKWIDGSSVEFSRIQSYGNSTANYFIIQTEGQAGADVLFLISNAVTQGTVSLLAQLSGTTKASLVISTAGVIINDEGNNIDFRLEGDTDQNLMFADASTDKVGIGKNNPSEKLDVSGNVKATSFISDGWMPYSTVIPTRSASDDPTYSLQFASVDLTGVLEEGQPVKWTQNSIVRYGFINSAPVYSGGNTTITVLTRLDSTSGNYDVLDTSTYPITNFNYSMKKQFGFGFPVDPTYWTVRVVDSSDNTQASPTPSTWYNLGSVSINIPIGMFRVLWQAHVSVDNGTNQFFNIYCTLSTANNSESDSEFTTDTGAIYPSAYATARVQQNTSREKTLILTTKATYYLNARTTIGSGVSAITIYGGSASPTIIEARCMYL